MNTNNYPHLPPALSESERDLIKEICALRTELTDLRNQQSVREGKTRNDTRRLHEYYLHYLSRVEQVIAATVEERTKRYKIELVACQKELGESNQRITFLEDECKKTVGKYENERKRIVDLCEEKLDEYKAVHKEDEQHIIQISRLRDEYRTKLNTSEEANRKKEQHIAQLETSLDEFRKELPGYDKASKEIEQQAARLNTQLKEQKQRAAKSQEAVERSEKEQRKLASALNDWKEKAAISEAAYHQSTLRNAELEANLEMTVQKRKITKQKVRNVKDEKQTADDMIEKLKQEKTELAEQLAACEQTPAGEWKARFAKIMREKTEADTKVANLETNIALLKQEKRVAEGEVAEMTTSYRQLQRRFRELQEAKQQAQLESAQRLRLVRRDMETLQQDKQQTDEKKLAMFNKTSKEFPLVPMRGQSEPPFLKNFSRDARTAKSAEKVTQKFGEPVRKATSPIKRKCPVKDSPIIRPFQIPRTHSPIDSKDEDAACTESRKKAKVGMSAW